MVVINVNLKINLEKETQYLQFVEDMVRNSRQDRGCLSYNHFRNVDHHDEYIIVENWLDMDCVEEHNNTDHFKLFLDKIPNYLVEEIGLIISHS